MKKEAIIGLLIILGFILVLGGLFHILNYWYTVLCGITFVTTIPIGWWLKGVYEKFKQLPPQ